MSECEHKQLVLTSQRGTDGLPIYRCAKVRKCGALFKVKPEEITVQLGGKELSDEHPHYSKGTMQALNRAIKESQRNAVAPPREELRARLDEAKWWNSLFTGGIQGLAWYDERAERIAELEAAVDRLETVVTK